MAKPILANNPYGVDRSTAAINVAAPFAPNTQTYHGFSIEVGGVTIGRIKTWTPQQLDRDAVHVYELNHRTFGQPVDIVPGVAKNFQVSFARAEVWSEELERALGADNAYTLLIEQDAPFTIDEVYRRGNSIYRRYQYRGCWFTQKNVSEFQSDGDAIIQIDGDLMFVNRVRL